MVYRLVPALLLAFFVFAQAPQAGAQTSDPAAATVQGFYDALTASMKSGGTPQSRYRRLKPAVDKAFDIPGMTALSIGPRWSSLSSADRKTLIEAFDRLTVADYAKNFDSFDGQTFTVDPQVAERGADKFVKTVFNPRDGNAIPFNYRLHQVNGNWKIVDVYLNGNISQLAEKRSDFGATLQASGPQGLAKKINALADQTLS